MHLMCFLVSKESQWLHNAILTLLATEFFLVAWTALFLTCFSFIDALHVLLIIV